MNNNLLRTTLAVVLFAVFNPIQAEELQGKQLPDSELRRLNAGEYDPIKGEFVTEKGEIGAAATDKAFGNPKYSVTVWTHNRNSDVFAFKDTIVLGAKANRDGYLTILGYDAKNEVIQLYPNQHVRDNYIRAGQTILIPHPNSTYEIVIEPPAGINTFEAYITDSPNAIYDEKTAQSFNDDFYPKSSLDGETLSAKIAIRLKDNKVKENWSAYRKVIRVVPNKRMPPSPPVINQNMNENIREELALGLTKEKIKDYQIFLRNEGYYHSNIDGVIGKNTRAALKAWQKFNKLPATGYFSVLTISYMR